MAVRCDVGWLRLAFVAGANTCVDSIIYNKNARCSICRSFLLCDVESQKDLCTATPMEIVPGTLVWHMWSRESDWALAEQGTFMKEIIR
jgi:hypothetical protein